MHFNLTAHIQFEPKDKAAFGIKRVGSVRIEGGWDMLTDTATITLPRNVSAFNRDDGIKGLFRRGDKVTIDLGYDNVNNTEFIGYLTEIGSDIPVSLKCEDSMWLLKQVPVNLVYSGTLSGLLQKILPEGMEYEAADIKLQSLKLAKTTVSKVLSWLKDNYGIYSYFKGEKLISGKVYLDDTETVKLDFNRNIKTSNLKYVRADELSLKVTCTSIRPDASNVSVTVGDSEGDESKFEYWGNHTEAELKEIANLMLEKLKIDGYTGDLTTWGVPFIQHGMIIDLFSQEYPERDGQHYVDRTTVEWRPASFTRRINPGRAA